MLISSSFLLIVETLLAEKLKQPGGSSGWVAVVVGGCERERERAQTRFPST